MNTNIEEEDAMIDDFLQKNTLNTSSTGMSIFGFNDDDDTDDDSLLVSPTPIKVNDYIGNQKRTNEMNPTSLMNESLQEKQEKQSILSQSSSAIQTMDSNSTSDSISNNTNTYHNKPYTTTTTGGSNHSLLLPPSETSFMSPTITTNTKEKLSSTSSKKHRTRSSARLRRRRQILFSSPKEEMFRLEEENEKSLQDKKRQQYNEDDSGSFDGNGDSIRDNTDDKNEMKTNQMSPRNNDYNLDDNRDSKTSNLLRGALDTSLCPSLGLGSSFDEDEERESDDDNNKEEERECDGDHNKEDETEGGGDHNKEEETEIDGDNYNDDMITEDKNNENRSNIERKSVVEENQEYPNEIREAKDEATVMTQIKNETTTTIENTNDETEIEFSPKESMLHIDHKVENFFVDDGICFDNSSSHNSFEEDSPNKNDSQTILSPKANDLENKENCLPIVIMDQNNQIQNHKDAIFDESTNNENKSKLSLQNDKSTFSLKSFSTPERKSISQTPPRSSSKKKTSLNLTPKLIREAAKQTLTPILNALRSKIMKSRESPSDEKEGIEMNTVNRDSDVTATREKSYLMDAPVVPPFPIDIEGNDNVVDSPTISSSQNGKVTVYEDEESICKALNEPRDRKEKDSISLNLGLSPSPNLSPSRKVTQNNSNGNDKKSDISSTGVIDQDSKTSGKQDFEEDKSPDDKTPGGSSLSPSLSLTPALKALRSKLLGKSSIEAYSSQKFSDFSVSPIGTTSPNTIDDTSPYRSSFFSPPIREPTNNKTPINKSNFTGDDSYLAQPKDLNSAKKNVNAQSSALAKRLRGAAQKRMVDLTRKRDSLAAKEVGQLERTEFGNELNHFVDAIPEEGIMDTKDKKSDKHLSKISKEKHEYNVFKARPIPASCKEGSTTSGVPRVRKKPVTKAISPKLGSRRPSSQKDCEVVKKETASKKKDPFYVSPFKARPLPSFIHHDDKENKNGVPRLKKHQPTVPVSPLLGLRRNDINKNGKQNIIKTKFKNTKNQNDSPISNADPVGLGFLKNTPTERYQVDNPPSEMSLHSAKRAKERARFNKALSMREKERERKKKIEVDLLIKQKLSELESLKQTLR